MRIEDFWIDMFAYYVTFFTNENVKITKLLFLPDYHIEREEICNIIESKFYNVRQVLLIEEWEEGLALKQSI